MLISSSQWPDEQHAADEALSMKVHRWGCLDFVRAFWALGPHSKLAVLGRCCLHILNPFLLLSSAAPAKADFMAPFWLSHPVTNTVPDQAIVTLRTSEDLARWTPISTNMAQEGLVVTLDSSASPDGRHRMYKLMEP